MMCPDSQTLLRQFVERDSQADAALSEHLQGCALCRGQVTDLRQLAAEVAYASSYYCDPQRRQRIAHLIANSELPQDEKIRRWAWYYWSGPLVAVGLSLGIFFLVLSQHSNPPTEDGYSIRGAPEHAEQWVGISAFVLEKHSMKPRRLTADSIISANDGLLFSYTNLRNSPYDHLVIVARDSLGKITWLHPADGGTSAIKIKSDVSSVEIPELIRTLWPSGKLIVVAIFSKGNVAGQTIEKWLQTAQAAYTRPQMDCAVQFLEIGVQ